MTGVDPSVVHDEAPLWREARQLSLPLGHVRGYAVSRNHRRSVVERFNDFVFD